MQLTHMQILENMQTEIEQLTQALVKYKEQTNYAMEEIYLYIDTLQEVIYKNTTADELFDSFPICHYLEIERGEDLEKVIFLSKETGIKIKWLSKKDPGLEIGMLNIKVVEE